MNSINLWSVLALSYYLNKIAKEFLGACPTLMDTQAPVIVVSLQLVLAARFAKLLLPFSGDPTDLV